MSQRYVHPRQQWMNHNGRPLSGGKLWFYESGTSTPKEVFAEVELETPLTQPVVADSAGVWPAIFLADEAYKVVCTNADNVTLWTEDPVNGIPTEGGPNLGNKDGVFNVKDPAFGAVGDGVTDDSVAWAAAITAALAAATDGSVRPVVYGPPGTYLWGDGAEMPDITKGIVIEGDATIALNRSDKGNCTFFHFGNPANDPPPGQLPAPGIQDPVVRNLKLSVQQQVWEGCEIVGPFDGSLTSWEPTFSEAPRRASNQMMIVDGHPYPVTAYRVTDVDTTTPTYETDDPPGATVWFLRVPETAWAVELMGVVRAHFENVTVLGAPGYAHEGYRQRSNGTRYVNCQAQFYHYAYPGSLTAPQAREDDDEDGYLSLPHPGWVTATAAEAADGSRKTFTFDLAAATPSQASTQLLGVEQLCVAKVNGSGVSAVNYSSTGWGTGEIQIVFDTAPANGATVTLEHYVIPVGLPTSYYLMNNSGPVYFEFCHWLGRGGDHSGGGAAYELVPDNGYPGAQSLYGGPTGDTKLWNQCMCQAFWQPFGASTAFETVTANEAANGTRDTFTFTFTATVGQSRFLAFVDGQRMAGPAVSVSGYGTATITVVFAEPPADGATVQGRRLITVTPLGKPYGAYFDYTKGHTSNVFMTGSVLDHYTVAGICIRTEPDANGVPWTQGGEWRSFTRVMYFNKMRIAQDKGRAFLLDAASSRPCDAITVEDLWCTQRRDDPVIEFGGNYSGLNFRGLRIDEFQTTSGIWPDRPPPIRVNAGSGDWSVTGSMGGNGNTASGTVLAPAVIEMMDPYARRARAVGNHFTGQSAFFKHQRYVSRVITLGNNPLQTLEVDADMDGEGDGVFNPNIHVHLPPGELQLKPGQFFTMAGAVGGNGVSADYLNGERSVGRLLGDDRFAIFMNQYYEGENPVNAAGFFGGNSITLTVYQDGYIRHEIDGTDLITTTNGSSVVTVEVEGHGAWIGEPVIVPSVQSAVGGIPAASIEGTWTVSAIPDQDHISFDCGVSATSDETAGGGGDITLQLWWTPDDNGDMVDIGNTPRATPSEESLDLPQEAPGPDSLFRFTREDGKQRARSYADLVDDIAAEAGTITSVNAKTGPAVTLAAADVSAAPATHVGSTDGHPEATVSDPGMMPAAAVVKLAGIEAGAQVNHTISTATPVAVNPSVSGTAGNTGQVADAGHRHPITAASATQWLAASLNSAVATPATWGAVTAITVLTVSVNIAISFTSTANHQATLDGNRNFNNPSNQVVGQRGLLIVIMDGTGGWTPTFATNWNATDVAGIVWDTAPGGVTILEYFVMTASTTGGVRLRQWL